MNQEQDIVYFAKTNFRSRERVFGIKRTDRRQHIYVMGQTGTGKSTFLKNIALQDVKSGRGICIVDPHGEFVEEVLTMIPEERAKDVIYFNPSDSEYPVGFNVLEVPDVNNPEYKPIAASSLMGIFTKIWANVWSARMEYILNNAILALLDNPGSTLLGVQRILVDKEYRKQILSNVKDPIVLAFWKQEYEQYEPRFRNEAIAPIQNKVGQFLSSSLIRNIVGQPQSSLNLYEAMNQEKIILVNVSKGRIGEDNSQLLGAMVITKLQLAAMERVRIPEEERKDFYLYVDEFQNFATDSFASILSEARKYRLNLVIAHQYVGQLVTDTSTRVRDAVFGNVGTLIIFRVGATDAEFLEKEFEPEVTIPDLVGLPNHHIYLKLMIDQVRSRPFSASTLPPLIVDSTVRTANIVIDASRKTYARKREDVEKEMNQWSGFGAKLGSPVDEKTAPIKQDHVSHADQSFTKKTPVMPLIKQKEIKPEPLAKPVPSSPIAPPSISTAPPATQSVPPLASPTPLSPSLSALSAAKPVSLSSLRPVHPAPSAQRHPIIEKKTPQRISELQSVLKGVLAKHKMPLSSPMQEKKASSGSLQPGERIKL
ncbi:MAG: hypothetical protein A2719_01405 [Candidatus Ryanbacteria bacterium RIFCSPHIGHO2_01_FULL_45_22]|uniref:Type IV secretion system coupling protein TraD DNA-binding domain-containing protein n=2 Tax=Candidatus Ryaniibacteriota TaxID=1817914 RepID=A0A1G2G097_9BACT|nr:MAG: hypothetical protein A2719_01405 [Candidatus Ryanbacteria bacterium RIFCSPHIGHO2_01_FULL_45_22]OGZ46380.1 MAG: hypothetical protein A3J54_04290 [Candidatus Ryanbacteria bacterium RIFCSPHIGHO2_02_FULL_45_13b]